jgi:hypothetical protein
MEEKQILCVEQPKLTHTQNTECWAVSFTISPTSLREYYLEPPVQKLTFVLHHPTKIHKLNFRNFGSGFIQIFASTLTQGLEYIHSQHYSDKTIQSDWTCILPDKQLMSMDQYKQRTQGKFDRSWQHTLPLRLQNTPYAVLRVYLRPFYDLLFHDTPSSSPIVAVGLLSLSVF